MGYREKVTVKTDVGLFAKRLRAHALEMTSNGKSSHIASILSICDILAVLYGDWLHLNPQDHRDKKRDRFVLSKGHAGAGVYAALAECGFINKQALQSHYKNGSFLSGHVSHKGIPGVEVSTGSLGQGLAIACGIALSGKLSKQDYRTVCLLSDGECDEGSNWEAFLFAAHHKLEKLTVIIDANKYQSIKTTTETLNLEPLADKLRAFNWNVEEIDGHCHSSILKALNSFSSRPKAIIANTIKGKGVSFMENNILWHYKSLPAEQLNDALQEVLL